MICKRYIYWVNNTGSFGSVSSMGIINHPQAAILQVESVVKKPVVIDDMIAIRNMVNLCISIASSYSRWCSNGKIYESC